MITIKSQGCAISPNASGADAVLLIRALVGPSASNQATAVDQARIAFAIDKHRNEDRRRYWLNLRDR